jgi:hypothetical protein
MSSVKVLFVSVFGSPSFVLPSVIVVIVVVAAAVLFEYCEELENTSTVCVCVKCLMRGWCHMYQQA